jgi:hypothetical protein
MLERMKRELGCAYERFCLGLKEALNPMPDIDIPEHLLRVDFTRDTLKNPVPALDLRVFLDHEAALQA